MIHDNPQSLGKKGTADSDNYEKAQGSRVAAVGRTFIAFLPPKKVIYLFRTKLMIVQDGSDVERDHIFVFSLLTPHHNHDPNGY